MVKTPTGKQQNISRSKVRFRGDSNDVRGWWNSTSFSFRTVVESQGVPPPRGFALLSWSLPSITIWVWSSSGIPGKAQWRPTNIHFTDLYSIGSVLNIVSQYCKFIELEQPKLWQRNTRNSFDVWSHTLLQIRIRAVALVEVKSIHAATQAFAKHLCQVPRGCP